MMHFQERDPEENGFLILLLLFFLLIAFHICYKSLKELCRTLGVNQPQPQPM